MKRVMLVDDDRHEAFFWRSTIERNFAHCISLQCHSSVEEALANIDGFQPDVIVLDNKVPPHQTAEYGLTELRKRSFQGSIFLWSYSDREQLRGYLNDWPDVEYLSKQDYMGMKVRTLIETRFM